VKGGVGLDKMGRPVILGLEICVTVSLSISKEGSIESTVHVLAMDNKVYVTIAARNLA